MNTYNSELITRGGNQAVRNPEQAAGKARTVLRSRMYTATLRPACRMSTIFSLPGIQYLASKHPVVRVLHKLSSSYALKPFPETRPIQMQERPVGANLEGFVDHCLHLAAHLALGKAFSLHEDPDCVGRLCGSFAFLFCICVQIVCEPCAGCD